MGRSAPVDVSLLCFANLASTRAREREARFDFDQTAFERWPGSCNRSGSRMAASGPFGKQAFVKL
jgi:hypothetical protein